MDHFEAGNPIQLPAFEVAEPSRRQSLVLAVALVMIEASVRLDVGEPSGELFGESVGTAAAGLAVGLLGVTVGTGDGFTGIHGWVPLSEIRAETR